MDNKKLTDMTAAELRERIVDLTAEKERDNKRLTVLEETIRHCPDVEVGYNDDEDEGPVGFYLEIGGCDPVKHVGATFREVLDSHIKVMRDGVQE